ncbi:transmembrane 7 superfamily member 3 [Aethina tumida]|uniref:transmembrane 7 superfamily member 3 n=1 Tax=Aethina tumida TaxID=116153 RepID=UPI002147ACED|nr:transmembrane 7 superfamily member 3 [Aethina tumida]
MGFKVVLCLVLVCFTLCGAQDITFDLSDRLKSTNILKQFYNFTNDRAQINIKNIADSVGFIIVQVHSHLNNVTLSSSRDNNLYSTITGTNIGLIYANDSSSTTFYLSKSFTQHNKILIVITIHKDTDPVPGGCNLTFNNKVAPYQMISQTDDMIEVNFQAPSGYGIDCDNNSIQIEKYHLFLPEMDNSTQKYFEYLQKMLTVEDITKHGYKVPSYEGYYKYKTLYSAYRGTGQVFAVVIRYNNASSAYIPAISYACNAWDWDDCYGPITTHWKFACATLLIFGLFVCFFGHYFFKTTLALVAYTFGVLLTFQIMSLTSKYSFEARSTTSLVLGIGYSVAWQFMWVKFGVPLLSALLTYFLAGYLVSSTVFYGLGDIPIFRNDENFWLTFVGISIVTMIILSGMFSIGHRLGCVLLGSYAVIVASNYYLGGYFQYIMINTIRRGTVKNFNMAVIDHPYQWKDMLQTVVWALLAWIGNYIQKKTQKGRAPFPNNTCFLNCGGRQTNLFNSVPTETTPLLRSYVPEYV